LDSKKSRHAAGLFSFFLPETTTIRPQRAL
jgi:hypothetical protein